MQVRFIAATTVCALVSGCGGGGSGGINPTPAPPPGSATPTPSGSANMDLLGPLLLSETFTNDAASGSATYPKNGGRPTTATAAASATIVYEASSQKYTLTVNGRTQSFLPSDIDRAQSSAAVTVYAKTSDGKTDSLTLTNAGTSGRFTYRYVAGGFWQRTADGTAAISGSLDSVAYGVETPSASVPRSGYASYSMDLIGAQTLADRVTGITGSGTLVADFAGGRLSTSGEIANASPTSASRFSGTARLSSTDGSFSGDIGLNSATAVNYNGALTGRFFGPAAEEVGATFSAAANDGNIVVGALLGRRNNVTGGNGLISDLTAAEFLNGDSARLDFRGLNTPIAVQAHGMRTMVAYYDPTQENYTVLLKDRFKVLTGAQLTNTGLDPSSYAGVGSAGSYASFEPLFGYPPRTQYLRAGRVFSTSPNYVFDDVVFGIATSNAATPRTGSAGYAVNLVGSIVETAATNVRTIAGTGVIIANFASSSLSAQGTLNDYFSSFSPPGIGTFSGSATIGASENSLSGALGFSGIGSYSGAWQGRFYGPAAEEIGTVFSLDGANGSVATGALFGTRDPAILASRIPLASITVPTQLVGVTAQTYIEPLNGQRESFIDNRTKVNFDPATGTYIFTSQYAAPLVGGSIKLDQTIAAGDKVAGSSDASYTHYHNSNVDGRLLNPGPGNPTITLTYTSLADMTATADRGGIAVTTQYLTAFGAQTSNGDMPRSGSANYSGILVGRGTQVGFSNDAMLSGTSTMAMDFGTGSGTASLTINATDKVSGAQMAIGTFNFVGGNNPITPTTRNFFTFNPSTFSNLPVGGAMFGQFVGTFNGPAAEEFGGAFNLQVSDSSGQSANVSRFEGVAVGKR